MRSLILMSLLAVGLTAPRISRAEAVPDADRLQAAAAVERAMGGEAQVIKSLTAMRPGMVNMLVQSSHVSIGRAAETWDTVLLPGMQAHIGEIVSANARILAEHFTTSELTDIKDFYLSPTGRKVIANQSAIAVERLRSMMPLMQDLMKRSAQRAQPAPGANAAPQSGPGH